MSKQNNCPTCSKQVLDDYSFCPYCGEALTEGAIEVIKEQNKLSQLKVIYLLIDKVKDPKTIELLQKLIEMYKSK